MANLTPWTILPEVVVDGKKLTISEERFAYILSGYHDFNYPISRLPSIFKRKKGTIIYDVYHLRDDQWRFDPDLLGFCPVWPAPWGVNPPTTSGNAYDDNEIDVLADTVVGLMLDGGLLGNYKFGVLDVELVDSFFLALTSFGIGWMNLFRVIPLLIGPWGGPDSKTNIVVPGPDDLEAVLLNTGGGNPSDGFLSDFECDVLDVWWAAVHFAVDLADWYPWKSTDATYSPDRFYKKSARTGDSSPPPVRGFEHTTGRYLRASGKGHNPEPEFCNPSVAAYFAKYIICGNSVPVEDLAAVDRLVAWYGGMGEGSYCNCEPLWPAKHEADEWCADFVAGGPCDLADIPLQPGAADLPGCPQGSVPLLVDTCRADGSQGWMHNYSDSAYHAGCTPQYMGQADDYALELWFGDRVLEDVVPPVGVNTFRRTFFRQSLIKQGGCGPSSYFFTASALAMNVPAQWGLTFIGGDRHRTVRLPDHELAILHGDDLWGPGARIFPPRQLWLPESVGLAPAKYWRFGLTNPTLPNMHAIVEDTARYYARRKYFMAFLEAAHDERYRQVILDAALFKGSEVSGIAEEKYADPNVPAIFGAMWIWLGSMSSLLAAGGAVQPAGWPGWVPLRDELLQCWPAGGPFPATIKEEPELLDKFEEVYFYFGLSGYQLPPGLFAHVFGGAAELQFLGDNFPPQEFSDGFPPFFP